MIRVDVLEISRYLGYAGNSLDERTKEDIAFCTEELMKKIAPRQIYLRIAAKEGYIAGIKLPDELLGRMEYILIAATLGLEVDRYLSAISCKSVTRAAVAEACATAMIEQYLDDSCDNVSNEMDVGLTPRFSPGYGSFSLEWQRSILDVLNAHRIGLTLSESMMIPRKSVTAVMGIANEFKGVAKRGCADCVAKCDYRRRDCAHDN